MQTATIASSYAVGGIAFSGNVTETGEGGLNRIPALPAGLAGTISAAGVDNMVTGHGIIATDVVDVHWDDPTDGTHKVRRGLLVDTANANDIAYDEVPAGEGDALPAVGTVCVVAVQVTVVTPFDGDLMMLIAAKATQKSVADFRTASASQMVLTFAADGVWSWASGQGSANPMAGDTITEVIISNGSTTAGTFYLGILQDSVA